MQNVYEMKANVKDHYFMVKLVFEIDFEKIENLDIEKSIFSTWYSKV